MGTTKTMKDMTSYHAIDSPESLQTQRFGLPKRRLFRNPSHTALFDEHTDAHAATPPLNVSLLSRTIDPTPFSCRFVPKVGAVPEGLKTNLPRDVPSQVSHVHPGVLVAASSRALSAADDRVSSTAVLVASPAADTASTCY